MALSNIGNEPRREITESVVGIAACATVIGLIGWGDYAAAQWLASLTGIPWQFGTVLIIAAAFVVSMVSIPVLEFTHELGEFFCDVLEDKGIHLRPRNRPKQ